MTSLRVGVEDNFPFSTEYYKTYVQYVLQGEKSSFGPGIDFEFLFATLAGLLRLNLTFVPVNSSGQLYQYFVDQTIDIPFRIYPMHTVHNYQLPSPIVTQIYPIFLVPRLYQSRFVSIFDNFRWQLWSLIAAFTVVAYAAKISKHAFTRSVLNYSSRSTTFRAWFLVFGMLLGLFSNLLTVDFLMPSKALVFPFTDLHDLGWKMYTNQCRMGIISPNVFDIDPSGYDPNFSWQLFENDTKRYYMFATKITTDYDHFQTRSEMVEAITESGKTKTCLVGVDFNSLEHYYESQCGLVQKPQNELIRQLKSRNGVFYYNIANVNKRLQKLINKIFNSSPVEKLYANIYQKYFRTYQFNRSVSNCNGQKDSDIKVQKLTVEKVADCFRLLAVGLTSGILCLGVETLRVYYFRNISAKY